MSGQEYSVNIVLPNDNVLPVSFTTVNNIKEEVEQKTKIPKDKQIFYREGERDVLSSDDIPEFLSMKPHLFVEDTRNPTEETNWTVDVYGYTNDSPVKATILVHYPFYLTDAGLKTLVQQKPRTLAIAHQTLYHQREVLPERKPLRMCKFWENGVFLFMEDKRNPTTERDWSIVVCGDFDDSPITVSVPFPSPTTFEVLKKSIENEIKVSPNEQTLYYEGMILPEDTSLVKCNGMKNGAAIYLAIKPVTINISVVHHPGANKPFQVKIPRKEFKEWKVSFLREEVCAKFGFDVNSNHILAVAGKTLTNDTMIKDQPEIKDGCNVTFTILQHAMLPTPTGLNDRKLTVPAYTSFKINSREALYERNLRYSPVLSSEWTVHVTAGDEKTPIHQKSISLSDCQFTPIFTLRKLIEKKLSVPSHQLELEVVVPVPLVPSGVSTDGKDSTASNASSPDVPRVIIKDWDEDGKVLLLCNYPSIHDKVTIKLVHVPKGIHVKLSGVDNEPLKVSHKNVIIQKNPKISPPNYINIPKPEEMTVHMLMNIMKNCGLSGEEIYKQSAVSSDHIPISDKPISSIKSITNGCVLMTTKPSGWFHRKSKKKQQNETKSR